MSVRVSKYWTFCERCGATKVYFESLKELKAWKECESGMCDGCKAERIEQAKNNRPEDIPLDHPDLCPQCTSALLQHKTGGKIDCPKCGFCLTCGLS